MTKGQTETFGMNGITRFLVNGILNVYGIGEVVPPKLSTDPRIIQFFDE